MKLDPILKAAIKEASKAEGVTQSSQAIIRLLEKYVINEIPANQIAPSLHGIYESFRGDYE